MIKKIHIKNFQAHADKEIFLDKKITTITGPTDSGKSSCLRALRWALLNEPRGTDFIRNDEKSCSVLVEFADGTEVVRSRKGAENLYRSGKQEFKAFGSGAVPEEISKATRMQDINFQLQHDRPFWFMETAGEVSRQLNKFVDLELIDKTLATMDSILRKARSEIEVVAMRKQQAKEKGQALGYVKDMDKEYRAIELLQEQLFQSRKNSGCVEGYLNETDMLSKKIKRKLPQWADWFVRTADKYKHICSSVYELKMLLENIEQKEARICKQKKEVPILQRLVERKVGKTCPLCGQPIPS